MITDTLRLGIPTASNFHCIITPGGKPAAGRERKTYMYQLVAERIMETRLERFKGNEHTQWGVEHEAEAAAALSWYLREDLIPVGFITANDGRWGCTPDRALRGKREAVEIKCPSTPWTHIEYMVDGPGEKYRPQVQGQLLIGEFEAIHFWAWHPRFASVYVRTVRDEKYLETMRELLSIFSDELDRTEAWVRRQGNMAELLVEAGE